MEFSQRRINKDLQKLLHLNPKGSTPKQDGKAISDASDDWQQKPDWWAEKL
jgi:hypothetical protein